MSWLLAYWWIPPLVTVAGMIPLFLYLERRRREAYKEFCLMRGFTFERSRHSSPQPYAAVPLLVAPGAAPQAGRSRRAVGGRGRRPAVVPRAMR